MSRRPSEINAEIAACRPFRCEFCTADLVDGTGVCLNCGKRRTDFSEVDRLEALKAEKAEIIRCVAKKIRAIREPVDMAVRPLRTDLAQAKRHGDLRTIQNKQAQIEEVAGWFMDWRNWLYTLPEDEREDRIDEVLNADDPRAAAEKMMPVLARAELKRQRLEGVDGE